MHVYKFSHLMYPIGETFVTRVRVSTRLFDECHVCSATFCTMNHDSDMYHWITHR